MSVTDIELERLRYPIWRCSTEPSLPPEQRPALIDDIAGPPNDLRTAVSDLSAEQLSGLVTLDSSLQLYAWHGRHHLAHITRLRDRLGWS